MTLPYQPYYCEENAYRICEMLISPEGMGYRKRSEAGGAVWSARAADAGSTGIAAAMLFIFSDGPWVTLFNQRAVAPGRPMYWDYHVIATAEVRGTWSVYDPDSLIPAGSNLDTYLTQTFPESEARPTVEPARRAGADSSPSFRWVPWETAHHRFGSDRHHMRTPDGGWTETPPPWPLINPEQHTLPEFLCPRDNELGHLYTLPELFAGRSGGN